MGNYKEMVILIAEDDDGHAELIQEGLVDAGICNKIIRFSNGEDVRNFLSGNGNNEIRDIEKSYLLLLDINMPIMDGLDATVQIKKLRKELPIVMQTAYVDLKRKGFDAGCDDFIKKPIILKLGSGEVCMCGI